MMRRMRGFEVARPKTKAEVLQLLGQAGAEARVLAGGTDLLVELKQIREQPRLLVSLRRVGELRYLDRTADGGLRIGAGTTVRMLQRAAEDKLAATYRSLGDACRDFASLQIRNVATVLGNLAHASPSADLAPPLITFGATAVITGLGGEREIPLEAFFIGPRQTVLTPQEVLAEVRVPPLAPSTGSSYQKLTVRELMGIAIVGVAATVRLDAAGRCVDARVALGAVAPVPRRAVSAEAVLRGQVLSDGVVAQAAWSAVGDSSPIDDVRASAEYRRLMVEELAGRALRAAVADATR